jgi:hypothetical protein
MGKLLLSPSALLPRGADVSTQALDGGIHTIDPPSGAVELPEPKR